MTLDEKIIHTTILIVGKRSDNVTFGTGFFFTFVIDNKDKPFIVTNKHVVSTSDKIELTFNLCDLNGCFIPGKTKTFFIENKNGVIINHPDSSVDLCLINIEKIINNPENHDLFFAALSQKLIPSDSYINLHTSNIENILLVGYPGAFIDKKNNLPITRRGITATSLHYDYNNKKEFLIDSAIFQGFSGSPVLIYDGGFYNDKEMTILGDRIKLVGILHASGLNSLHGDEFIKQNNKNSCCVNEIRIPNSLGFVIKASCLLDFQPLLNKRFPQKFYTF